MNDHIPDATKMISDTPRTDAEEYESQDEPITKLGSVDAEFARTLERELNAANDHIKRLEEAGDALCENSNLSRWDSPAAAARKLTEQSNWNKAKEAKP
jgi:hypothetical protein